MTNQLTFKCCQHCGAFYEKKARDNSSKYCSHTCRQKAYMKRNGLRLKRDQYRLTDMEYHCWNKVLAYDNTLHQLIDIHIDRFGLKSAMSMVTALYIVIENAKLQAAS